MSDKKKVTAESYTLYTENGGWLGQVVITNDGLFAGVTDWGNYSYAWRAYGGNFKEFLIRLEVPYFAAKMYTGSNTHCSRLRDLKRATDNFAERILPALQAVLKAELE